MAEARVYACPVCGAFARSGERSCRHCESALFTLRCSRCFDLSFPTDLHCRGCGFELGLEPIPHPSSEQCPDCRQPFVAFATDVGELRACERCGGQMVTHGLLRALIEQREALGRAVSATPVSPRPNPAAEPVRYRPCPTCGVFMNRKNFGTMSGVVVDVCLAHGTFFDAGELPRVLDFVRRGGLARANAVLKEAPKAASSSSFSDWGGAEAAVVPDWKDLLNFVVDVLRRR
jgi:Zn-finger nucleic acid-binding protein